MMKYEVMFEPVKNEGYWDPDEFSEIPNDGMRVIMFEEDESGCKSIRDIAEMHFADHELEASLRFIRKHFDIDWHIGELFFEKEKLTIRKFNKVFREAWKRFAEKK